MSDMLADLPDEVRALVEPHAAPTPELLADIGVAIAKKRDDAKAARASSGVEAIWKDCEEAYVGIDDANRHEFNGQNWSKPMSMTGPVTTDRTPNSNGGKSTVFVRVTARYVDAGAAKLAEILLPADDKAFSFSETPVPDLIKAKDDESQVFHEGLGVPLTRPPGPQDLPPAAASPPGPPTPGAPPAAPQVPLTVKDLALENIEMARKKAKAAEQRIYDWMIESQYTAEMRKVIHDAARVGVGVLKAPFPKVSRAIAVQKSGKGIDVNIRETVAPAVCWVDFWNIFPHGACGENIHDGDYVFERDYMSERQVRKLKDEPGYIAAAIDRVIEEGPDKANEKSGGNAPGAPKQKDRYEIWYFFGTIKREEMGAIQQASGKSPEPGDSESVHAIVTLINEHVVRATINPLDSGSFPYHSVPWQRRGGQWAGIGVAEQLKTPQRMVNAATRAMLNNAGKSAGTQVVVDRAAIEPADDVWAVTPDKLWYKKPDSAGNDVKDAFAMFEIPNMTDPLMKVINYGLQLAEESTSIPLITQGQSGATTPDTFGAAQLQNNNANQLLRSIGYAFDDYITEPVVRQYYEWLLLDPNVPDDEKGDYTIYAHGSIALVERAIQDQFLVQMAGMVTNPIFGVDPKKWMKQTLKSKRLNPDDVLYTEEEQARIAAQPPPEAPAVTVAKIGADKDIKLGVMKQTADQQTAQAEERVAAAANELEGHKTLVDATTTLHELQMRHDLALMDYAAKNQISLAALKTELAKTVMQLQTERELNAQNNQVAERKHRREMQQRNTPKPPVQAPGRAGNGQAFTQAPAQ